MSASVSVILPVRDAAASLGEQLDALGRQTYAGEWELLLSVQRSTDGTVAIVEQRAAVDPRIRVVDASGLAGAGYARNLGAAHATAPLLAFCDADDVVDDGWLEALVAADGDVRAGLMVPFRGAFDRDAVDVGLGYLPPVEGEFLPTAYTCNLLVRRDLFEEVGGFDLHFHRNHDVELSWRLQVHGARIVAVKDAVVFKRDRDAPSRRWLQSFRWARYEPALYRRYRAHGMPPSPPKGVAHDWAWLAVVAPVAWARRFRELWLDRSARRAGRLVGSVLERTAYL